MSKPKIIVFCGSSRFVDVMAVAAWMVERDEQAIAMGLHLLPGWYLSPKGELPANHLAEYEGVAEQMDALHLRKIDLADEIFVINVNDYIGSSTSNEIGYAKMRGKHIRWFTHDPIGQKIIQIANAADLLVANQDQWTKTPPSEPGLYWWNNGDPDDIEGVPVDVMKDSAGRLFAPLGQHGWNRPQFVDSLGGWWLPCRIPHFNGLSERDA